MSEAARIDDCSIIAPWTAVLLAAAHMAPAMAGTVRTCYNAIGKPAQVQTPLTQAAADLSRPAGYPQNTIAYRYDGMG